MPLPEYVQQYAAIVSRLMHLQARVTNEMIQAVTLYRSLTTTEKAEIERLYPLDTLPFSSPAVSMLTMADELEGRRRNA